MNTTYFIIAACSIVILSYIFSIISKQFRIPSVLLLLATGICLKYLTTYLKIAIAVPDSAVELLGSVGLTMIVLEAGLDLKLGRDKIPVIRNSFFSALIILLISTFSISGFLYYLLSEPFLKCIVYAIPLSIISSAVVIPSIGHLGDDKREFLVYETSFSDILGILLFNYFTAHEILTWYSIGIFTGNIVLSIIISIILSFLLFYLLLKSKIHVRFFLVFALLVLLETLGKMVHLPSLLIILVYGLLINNWELLHTRLKAFFPRTEVEDTLNLLQSITAESSFLIRTFFFLLFGFTFNIELLLEPEVALIGSIIVAMLLIIRYFYLRVFIRSNIYPEVFYIPRGLITILLFYKIPVEQKLGTFSEGIVIFVILATSLIMMLGMIFDKSKTPVLDINDIEL